MTNIKKTIYIFLISLIFICKSNAEIKNSLFATVGNKAITQTDIVNEIKIILILNNKSYTPDKKVELQKMAVKSLIKRNVKLIEVEKYDLLEYSKNDVNSELTRLANRINLDVETLKNLCASNGINFVQIVDQVKIELLWNSLIFQIYKDRLSINIEEIEDQLKNLQNKKKINEYLISEILIKPLSENTMNDEIQQLKKNIEQEGFETTAMNFSISSSSNNEGDLGWVNENSISSKIKSQIIATKVGNISEPIILPEGVLIFKVRDKRIIKETLSLEESKDKLVNAEKTKVLNMHSLSHYDNLRRSISVKFY